MAQDAAFKDSVLLVNSDLIGILRRVNKKGAVKNYALRPSWGTSDRLRGVLGKYYAVYQSAKGPNLVNLGADHINNRYHAKQIKNIPLTLTPIPAELGDLPGQSEQYLIELDNTAWNKLTFFKPTDSANLTRIRKSLIERGVIQPSALYGTGPRGGVENLLRQIIEEEGVYEGDPYWDYFLKSGFSLETDPIKAGIGPTIDTTGEFTDLTMRYVRASDNKDIRAKSGMSLKVEAVYNYYADTTPPYEIASLAATEPMLTNFYCLESEMRNTSPTLNSNDYFNQITLANELQQISIDNDEDPDPWFGAASGQEGTFTESKTVQLYSLYSKGLGAIRDKGILDEVKDTFNRRYKNIVILNSDLGAMNDLVVRDDQTSGLSNLPFYNKIIIGRDMDNVDDPANQYMGGGSFMFHEMRQLDETYGEGTGDQFLDILQMYIIQNIESAVPTESPFKARSVTRLSDSNPSNLSLDVTTRAVSLHFDMDKFLEDITMGDRIEQIVDRIETNETADDNFILIRNYNQEPLEVTQQAADNFLARNENKDINYPLRNVEKVVFKNQRCYSESIMYKIDKRVVNQGNVSDPVQTIYIGALGGLSTTAVNYIDSQVKYGVRYQYDISQIRMVFGNKYSYRDLKIFFSAVAGYGRAVGNALGFYRDPDPALLLDDHVEEYVKEYTPTDEDLPYSSVGIDTVAAESTQTGYYIFKASNPAHANKGLHQKAFLNGTQFVGTTEGSADDIKILKNIGLQIKEGFGFSGNSSGGAVPGALTLTTPQATVDLGAAAAAMAASATAMTAHAQARLAGTAPGSYSTPAASTTATGPSAGMGPPSFMSNLLGEN